MAIKWSPGCTCCGCPSEVLFRAGFGDEAQDWLPWSNQPADINAPELPDEFVTEMIYDSDHWWVKINALIADHAGGQVFQVGSSKVTFSFHSFTNALQQSSIAQLDIEVGGFSFTRYYPNFGGSSSLALDFAEATVSGERLHYVLVRGSRFGQFSFDAMVPGPVSSASPGGATVRIESGTQTQQGIDSGFGFATGVSEVIGSHTSHDGNDECRTIPRPCTRTQNFRITVNELTTLIEDGAGGYTNTTLGAIAGPTFGPTYDFGSSDLSCYRSARFSRSGPGSEDVNGDGVVDENDTNTTLSLFLALDWSAVDDFTFAIQISDSTRYSSVIGGPVRSPFWTLPALPGNGTGHHQVTLDQQVTNYLGGTIGIRLVYDIEIELIT